MMMAAQHQQVIDLRFSAVRPMPDVVRIEMALPVSSPETGSTTGRVTSQARRTAGGMLRVLRPTVEGFAVFDDSDEAGITGQPPGGFRRNRRTGAPSFAAGRERQSRQRGFIDVYDHLIAIGSRADGARWLLEKGLRNQCDGVGAPCGEVRNRRLVVNDGRPADRRRPQGL